MPLQVLKHQLDCFTIDIAPPQRNGRETDTQPTVALTVTPWLK
jgi:hypothetical protein